MPEQTRGPQKVPYSVRQGGELVGRGFHGYETDNDDPANMQPGSFRIITNVRLKHGAIFPRGGMRKVNAVAFSSGVVGLHLTGDGSLMQCAGSPPPDTPITGGCGKADTTVLIWTHIESGKQRSYVVYYLDGSGDFCSIVNPDQGEDSLLGRPYYGLEDGLGATLYTPGSGGDTGAKEMRVSKMSRGPYPLQSGGVLYTYVLDTLFRTADPYDATPASGFFSMASLEGAPDIGGDGETFFLGWGRKDAEPAAGDDFHVYRYEVPTVGAPVFVGELLFDTAYPGLTQVFVPGNGEVVAVLNATEQGTGANQPHDGHVKVRDTGGTWADITLDVSSVDGLDWVTPESLRNVIVFDSAVFDGKLWLAVSADAFAAGDVLTGHKHGYLLSYDVSTGDYVAEHVLQVAASANHILDYSNVVSLYVQGGKLWYAWNGYVEDLGTDHAYIGSFNGTTWTDTVVELSDDSSGIPDEDQVKTIRHLIFAAGKWWAVVDGNGGSDPAGIGAVISTEDLTMAAGWATVHALEDTADTLTDKNPPFVKSRDTPIEEAIPNIVVF